MSDYGTFESLGHEGYDKKIAAEKRDEALDRAAARIIEDTGDFFRNAASQDDFNQRWDMGITNVRRAAAKETETSDDTMNAIRERVAALTIDTKPKPRKRATRRKASAPAKRRTATHVTWENDGFGTDMFGNEYTISLGGAGEYDLTVNDGLTTTTVGRYPTREQAQDAARAVYARRSARRKQAALVWVEDPMEPDEYLGSDPALGTNQYAIVFNGVGWELILESLLSHHSETIGVYDSIDAAKQAADHALVSARRTTSRRTARRKQAAQWENDGENAVRIEFPPGYWYRVQETFQGDFEVSHNGDDGTPWTFGPYDTLEEAKAEAIDDAKTRGVYREASHRVAMDIDWMEDNGEFYGANSRGELCHITPIPGGGYSLMTGTTRGSRSHRTEHATLEEAKAAADLPPSQRAARRKAASVSPEQVTIDGKTGYMYQTDGLYDYLVYPNADGTYWDLYSKYRINDRFVWSQAGLNLSEAQQEAVYQIENDTRFTDNPDREAPKATATTLNTPKGDTIRIASRRKSSALTWEQDGVGAYADKGDNTAYHIFKYPGDEYFSIKYYSDRANGDGRIIDHASTLDEAKSIAEQEDTSGRTARRKRAFNSYTDWADFSAVDEAGYAVDTSDGGTYYVVTTDGASWTVYFESLEGDMETVRDNISDPDVAKAVAGDHNVNRRPNAYDRTSTRRKQAWRITKNRDWSGSQLRQVSDTMYSIYPPSGADNIDGRFAVQKAIDRSRMVRRMELRYAPPWTSTNMPDDVVVGYYDTPEEAFQAVLSGEAFNKLDQIKNSNFKGAGRKQAWAMSDDGMTYTSTQVQDSFDCPACGTGNKLGFSRCACGKQWNSYTIEGANGERRMVAREVEARPEAVLAKRRQAGRRRITQNRKVTMNSSQHDIHRRAQRKQAGTLQWTQDPQEPNSWSAESGPWAFDIVIGTDLWVFKDYQDGDMPISVKTYPDTDSAKRAAEDIANGIADPDQGVTARRKRLAGRTEESRTKSAYQAGRRAAQRNLPPNPNAPLAYLTGYRDYLRSAIKRG